MADLFSAVYNPDVLSCLSNLSNDEVFTPPELANEVLNMLPESIWLSTTARFLDPCSKSGVFLREIVKRLIRGQLPDYELRCAQIDHKRIMGEDLDGSDEAYLYRLQKVIDHILHEQVFAIAITELTALMSRRSLYCSKWANGPYTVSQFNDVAGNVRYKALQHTWVGSKGNEKCKWCGATKKEIEENRTSGETHAYELIHTTHPERLFKMQFDVIVGNPPYQVNDGGGNGASARPIYHLFVEQAKKLNPRYLTMITPSRWFTGGKGLDSYRETMLHDTHLRILHDYPEASDCFSGVQIKGGVSYFLWDRDYSGDCSIFTHRGTAVNGPVVRPLLEKGSSTFIRYNEAVSILHKVMKSPSPSMEDIVSARMPFGIPNTYKGRKKRRDVSDLRIYVSGNDREVRGSLAYVPKSMITKGQNMILWSKVFIAKAGSGSDVFPHPILPRPFYGSPGTVCNESYLVIGPFDDKEQCENVMSYIATKFFRFLVMLRKSSQNAPRGVYRLVPQQDWSKSWTDEELYKKYGLTQGEIDFIESMIKPMELGD